MIAETIEIIMYNTKNYKKFNYEFEINLVCMLSG
jgi:hypothetical protein